MPTCQVIWLTVMSVPGGLSVCSTHDRGHQHERVVVAVVPKEVDLGVGQPVEPLAGIVLLQIESVGDREAEDVTVERRPTRRCRGR